MERKIEILMGAKNIIDRCPAGKRALGKLRRDIEEASLRYVLWTITNEEEFSREQENYRMMEIDRCSVAARVGNSKEFLFAVGVEQRKVKK